MHNNIMEECQAKRGRKDFGTSNSSNAKNTSSDRLQAGSSSKKAELPTLKQKLHLSDFVKTNSVETEVEIKPQTGKSSSQNEHTSVQQITETKVTVAQKQSHKKQTPEQSLQHSENRSNKHKDDFLGKRIPELDSRQPSQPKIGEFVVSKVPTEFQMEPAPLPRVISSMKPITISPYSSSTPQVIEPSMQVQSSVGVFLHPDSSKLAPKPAPLAFIAGPVPKTPGEHLTQSLTSDALLDNKVYYRFEEFLGKLCKDVYSLKIQTPRANRLAPISHRETVYQRVLTFVHNFKHIPINSELLVKKKIGRYINLIYSLLRDINDQQSQVYSTLFMETDLLLQQMKKLAIKFVGRGVLLSTKREKRQASPARTL